MPELDNQNTFVPPQVDGAQTPPPPPTPVQPPATPLQPESPVQSTPPTPPPPATPPLVTPPPLENQPTQTASTPSLIPEKTKPKKKLWGKIIIIVVIVIAVAGAAYGAWFGYQTYFGDDSEKVFWEAIENFRIQERMEVSGDVQVSLSQMQKNDPNSNLNTIKDLFLGTDENSFSASFETKYDKSSANTLSQSNIDITWNNQELGNIETKKIGEELFLKPTIAKGEFLVALGGFNLPEQWIELSKDGTRDIFDMYGSSWGEEITDNNIKIQNVMAIIKTNKPFIIEVINKDDQTLGESAYLYNLSLERQGVDSTIAALINLVEDPDRRMNLQQRYQNLTDEEWAKIKDTKITVWVTKSDNFMKKVAFNYYLSNETNYNVSRTEIDFTLNFKPLTEELAFSRPTNTMTGEEYFNNMFMGIMEDAEEQAGDAKTISDIKMVQTALELYFVDNNEYPIAEELSLNEELQLCQDGGFIDKDKRCPKTVYMSHVPDNDILEFVYSSTDGVEYSIIFMILGDVGDLKSGLNFATQNGIESADQSNLDIAELEQMYANGELEEENEEEVMINDEVIDENVIEENNNEEIIDEEYVEENEEEVPTITDDDSDGDGLTDEEEAMYGSSYLLQDTDDDGLTDYEEVMDWGTDPTNPDTDGDGYNDGEEVGNGYNPNGPGKLFGME